MIAQVAFCFFQFFFKCTVYLFIFGFNKIEFFFFFFGQPIRVVCVSIQTIVTII